MTTNQLYLTWFAHLRQLWPHARVTRVQVGAWLVTGIYQSRSVQLSKIAGKIPGRARHLSIVRRLSRWLDNPAVRVRAWYRPVAQHLIQAVVQSGGEVRLIADGTKVGAGHQLLLVSIAFRRRALPLAWTWVRSPKGHSSARKQRALLAYVRTLIPAGVGVGLVGDSEFGAVAVLQQLDTWRWWYVVRQKANHLVKLPGHAIWQPFGCVVQTPGHSRWLGAGWLTAEFAYPVKMLAHWDAGEKEPWLLATNLPSARAALRAYRRRMWTEELFGDLKGHGFDLERTHLRHFLRLSRLTLAVAVLYVWLMAAGTQAIKRGRRSWVDRHDRRDLSLFQIGWRIIERYMTNGIRFQISFHLCT